MKVVVDIMHIPHINFLKNAIKELVNRGIEVDVICLDRGKNVLIAKEELKNVTVTKIGVHKGSFMSIIFQANVFRFFKIFNYLLHNKYDKGLSVGGFLLGFALKVLGKPNLQFYDDPENKKNKFFQKITANKLLYPGFYKEKGIENFNALKEWAYLSPKYFHPDINCLREYELNEKQYIFVREVRYTTNYAGQSADLISTIAEKFPKHMKVVLSLENKEKMDYYPKSWIILKEPVSDIHSLMYYSKVVVSSGDSMTREGAMMGVPSIYCGVREMAANRVMEEKKTLFQIDVQKVPTFINEILLDEIQIPNQIEFRNTLLNDWDDVTEVILSNILSL